MDGRIALREPIDLTFYAVNSFLALVNLAVALFTEEGSGRHLAVAAAFLAVCAVPTLLSLFQDWALSRRRDGRAARSHPALVAGFLRTFYIHAFYGPYFAEVILLSQAVWGGASLDAVVAGMEELVFGFQPALLFHRGLSQIRLVNELFFGGYFSYYLILTTGFWVMYARGRVEAARRGVFLATTAFALLYVWYVFVPVHGPKYFFETLNRAWYTPFEGYLFVPALKLIFNNMSLAGAALPSSHVAIGLITLLVIRPYLPRLYKVYLALFMLLCLSTVYIYAHYAIDVVAGLLVVPLLLWATRPLYRAARAMAGSAETDAQKNGAPG